LGRLEYSDYKGYDAPLASRVGGERIGARGSLAKLWLGLKSTQAK